MTPNRVVLVAAGWMAATANHAFFGLLWRSREHDVGLVLLMASLFLAIVSLTFGVTRLIGPGVLLKPAIGAMLIIAAVVSWFVDTYGVVMDADMLRNVVETNAREAGDFVGWPLLWRLLWLAVLPLAWLWRVRIEPAASRWRGLASYGVASLAGFVGVLAVGMPLYKQYASFFRNYREAYHLIAPCNFLDAAFTLTKRTLRARQPYLQIGLDAKRVAVAGSKPLLVVFVVGETARAANFSLHGYARATNPRLAKRDAKGEVYYFTDVHSCGTATAISVPCMFSGLPRAEFDVGRSTRRDNVLDVLQRAGMAVNWIDNQSGCKGVCARVPNESAADLAGVRCGDETCNDELLLKALDLSLPKVTLDSVLVLHQMGSHGPAYFRRSTPQFKPFQPECATERIETCSTEQIVAAYDNSIVYTDYILDSLIARLEAASERIDSVLLYVSDHGESLGEGGLYLHGETYMIAPQVQTGVPMLLWFSPQAPARLGVDTQCLRQRLMQSYSHDDIAPTLLGLASISTAIYRPQLDLLAACRSR